MKKTALVRSAKIMYRKHIKPIAMKKKAKELMAEKVLEFLLAVEERRERTRRILEDEDEEFEG